MVLQGARHQMSERLNMSNRSDNFDRANGAIGTPSDGGSAWQNLSGTWSISGNRATTTSYDARTVLDSGSSNVVVSANNLGSTYGALVLRALDNTNYIRCQTSSTQALIYKVVAGVSTQLAVAANTHVAGDILSASINASNLIQLFVNGILKCSATDSAGSTNTKHGIWGNNTGTYMYDDFSITDIIATPVPVMLSQYRNRRN
jgi:hypothetical protein